MSVGELLTAAKMNSHWSDNLRYLKGLDGAVTISDELLSVVANGGSLTAQGTANGAFARLRLLAKQTAGTVVDWRLLANGISGAGELSFYDATAGLERMRIDSAGNVGIGTSAPQGKLHVGGVGGGMLYLSATAVNATLQTLAQAGTVTKGAIFYALDVNNNGGAIAVISGSGQVPGGAGFGLSNTDICTVAVTAGGAITVQRTTGTNGTHEINLWILYK